MRVVFGLLAVLILIGVVLFFVGGLSGYDPAEQAAEFKANVKPGDPWTKVLDARPPKTWAVIDYNNQYSMDPRSASRDFDEPSFRDAMAKGTGPADGFIFEYVFDTEHAYDVWFDPAGNVTQIEDRPTASDLLNGGMGD
ncbi:MAG: hypothetical protein AAGH88_07135 [Planctomycetota bacterium]